MLVDSRASLYVIYPGLHVNSGGFSMSSMDAAIDIGDDDPFSGNINFGLFANATGGKLYFNRNDLAHLIGRSEQLGSEYYTLTYQPTEIPANGKFQRIRVTLNHPGYRIVTKAGYFAPDPGMHSIRASRQWTTWSKLPVPPSPSRPSTSASSPLVQHPDTRTLDIVIQMQDKNLSWLATGDGKARRA